MIKISSHKLISIIFFLVFIIGQKGFSQQKVKTNILFIAVDDMRPILGCYGNSTVHSPNIDRLANNGVMFSHAYCQVSVCNPSRSSIMTGLRPDELQVWTNVPHFRENKPDAITIPQFFKEKGYVAREIGKIFHDPAYHKDPVSWSGPSFYNVTQNGRGHKYNLLENCEPHRVKAAATEFADVSDTAYVDGKVCQAAISVLNEVKDSSFFLAVGFRRPHLPFSVPAKYWDLYKREEFTTEYKDTLRPNGSPEIAFHNSNELRGYDGIVKDGKIPESKQLELLHGYYASISYVDAQIGKLLVELKRLDLEENTVVVLWSDHGYHIGDFGLWCKATNFEAATRVPLIFSGPGIPKGLVESSIVELIDIYPNLVELAGFEQPATIAGKSSPSILKNKNGIANDYAISQFVRPYSAIGSRNPEIMGYSIRTQKYRYTEWRSFPDMVILEKELYLMEEKNIEKYNLAGDKKFDSLMNELSQEIEKNALVENYF